MTLHIPRSPVFRSSRRSQHNARWCCSPFQRHPIMALMFIVEIFYYLTLRASFYLACHSPLSFQHGRTRFVLICYDDTLPHILTRRTRSSGRKRRDTGSCQKQQHAETTPNANENSFPEFHCTCQTPHTHNGTLVVAVRKMLMMGKINPTFNSHVYTQRRVGKECDQKEKAKGTLQRSKKILNPAHLNSIPVLCEVVCVCVCESWFVNSTAGQGLKR